MFLQITYMCQMSYYNIVPHSYFSINQLKYKELFYPESNLNEIKR